MAIARAKAGPGSPPLRQAVEGGVPDADTMARGAERLLNLTGNMLLAACQLSCNRRGGPPVQVRIVAQVRQARRKPYIARAGSFMV